MYRFYQGALPDKFWLSATLDLLRKCDAILLLDGWQNSVGSQGEYAEAQGRMPVFFQEDIFGICPTKFERWLVSDEGTRRKK